MKRLLIRNSQIIDGTGKPAFPGDVLVEGQKIIAVGKSLNIEDVDQIIDAHEMVLAPGFIDPHTHSDYPLLIEPKAESKIRQGVTTEVIGNCGGSPAPLIGAALEEAKKDTGEMAHLVDWVSMGEYIEKLNQNKIALNVVPLVGHNTVRASVLGYDDVKPDAKQQAELERLTDQAMAEGAYGISTGLFYPPGLYANTEEVIGIAKVVARHGGVYASHIRSESDGLFESVEEALEIGRKSGARVQISHLKLEGKENFGGVDKLLEMIENANVKEGLEVGADQYPYIASSTWLASLLPEWAQAGGGAQVANRLKDPQIQKGLVEDFAKNPLDWENRGGTIDWTQILITDAEKHPEIVGKTVQQIAEEENKDPLKAVFDLIILCEGGPGCVFFDQLEENVRKIMQNPRVVVSSDGLSMSPYGYFKNNNPHPRSYGTFPRVLGKYVREEKILSLEAAVHKMTLKTAQYMNIKERGIIKEGAFADLVIFDPAVIRDQATFTQPHQYPAGIPYVIVNGTPVIENGEHTGNLPGYVL